MENSFLRFLLLRVTEDVKEAEKVANFMKCALIDKNVNNLKQYMKKSNFLEGQSEVIAKLRSQIAMLHNSNL